MTTINYGEAYQFYAPSFVAKVVSSSLDSTHIAIAYGTGDNSGWQQQAVIGTIAGDGAVSYGAAVDIPYPGEGISIAAVNSSQFVVTYRGDDGKGYAILGTVSNGNVISFGVRSEPVTGLMFSVYAVDTTRFLCLYYLDGGGAGQSVIGTISNEGEISFGTPYAFCPGSLYPDITATLIDSAHFVIGYSSPYSAPPLLYAVIGTISNGDEIVFGNSSSFSYISPPFMDPTLIIAMTDNTHFVFAYNGDTYLYSIIGTIANVNEISFGSQYIINPTANGSAVFGLGAIGHTQFVVVCQDYDGEWAKRNYTLIGSVAGNVISYGDPSDNFFVTDHLRTISVPVVSSSQLAVVFGEGSGSGFYKSAIGTYTSDIQKTYPVPIFRPGF